MGGRVIMINAVLNSIPTYRLYFYKEPTIVLKEITKIQSNFQRNGVDLKKYIHWVIWSKVCMSKENGGLGVKNIELFNKSLLLKWRWRILQENRLFGQES